MEREEFNISIETTQRVLERALWSSAKGDLWGKGSGWQLQQNHLP